MARDFVHLLAVGDEDRAVGWPASGRPAPARGCIAILPVFVVLLARFDQAHAAARHDRQARMPAVIRNLDAGALGRLNAVEALFIADGDFDSVDDDGGHSSKDCRIQGDGFSGIPTSCDPAPARPSVSFQPLGLVCLMYSSSSGRNFLMRS